MDVNLIEKIYYFMEIQNEFILMFDSIILSKTGKKCKKYILGFFRIMCSVKKY